MSGSTPAEIIFTPIAITMVDWKTFVGKCPESPTRGLDDTYIKLNDPQAYLACLSFDNKPLEHLRHGYRECSEAFQHVSISFICEDTYHKIARILGITSLKKMYHEPLLIITGDIREYIEAVILCCGRKHSQQVGSQLYKALCGIGFKEIFTDIHIDLI